MKARLHHQLVVVQLDVRAEQVLETSTISGLRAIGREEVVKVGQVGHLAGPVEHRHLGIPTVAELLLPLYVAGRHMIQPAFNDVLAALPQGRQLVIREHPAIPQVAVLGKELLLLGSEDSSDTSLPPTRSPTDGPEESMATASARQGARRMYTGQ